MEKIASFTVNHLNLLEGLYVSRIDENNNNCVTTFDLRMTKVNKEPVMNTAGLHTIEHLGATYLRNCARKDEIVYFGPMGCRTGFYLIVFGKQNSEDVYQLINDMCDFILAFEGDIPGAKIDECGNYLDQNLSEAKYYISHYKKELENKRFVYPQ